MKIKRSKVKRICHQFTLFLYIPTTYYPPLKKTLQPNSVDVSSTKYYFSRNSCLFIILLTISKQIQTIGPETLRNSCHWRATSNILDARPIIAITTTRATIITTSIAITTITFSITNTTNNNKKNLYDDGNDDGD